MGWVKGVEEEGVTAASSRLGEELLFPMKHNKIRFPSPLYLASVSDQMC